MTTCMAISLSFLPNCGNKYFIAACDDGIKLFDFEQSKVFFIIILNCYIYIYLTIIVN
jgi:hypothetical protein